MKHELALRLLEDAVSEAVTEGNQKQADDLSVSVIALQKEQRYADRIQAFFDNLAGKEIKDDELDSFLSDLLNPT